MNLTIRQTIAFIGVARLVGSVPKHLSYDQSTARTHTNAASGGIVRHRRFKANGTIHAVMLYGQKWNNM